MSPTQHAAPILDSIVPLDDAREVAFTIPGHKAGRGAPPDVVALLGADVFRRDVPLIGGVDGRLQQGELLDVAQQLAADAFGADAGLLICSGSSRSGQIAICAACKPGDEIIVTRATHQSVTAGLILSGARPVYLWPELDPEWNVPHGLTAAAVDAALSAHPDAVAVFEQSPSFFGVTPDVRAIARVAHARDTPLIVDEAWGAHFAFHGSLPRSAMHEGADVAYTSLHKTLPVLAPASLLMYRGSRVDPARIEGWQLLLETTSISVPIVASADGARRLMATEGSHRLGVLLAELEQTRARIAALPGLRVLGREVLGRAGAFALDPTKVVVDVRGLGLTGFAAYDWVRAHCALRLELADQHRVVAIATTGDTPASLDALARAFESLAARGVQEAPTGLPLPDFDAIPTVAELTPREAFFAERETVALASSVGRVAAELVTPYPPGIPVLAPGDRITAGIIDYLRRGIDAGMLVRGAADDTLATVRVVR